MTQVASTALVLLLLWIYYSSQILFFGAEFTQVYANTYGSKIVPAWKEKTVQPEPKGTRQLKGQSVLPASARIAISARESQLEKEYRQTVRLFLGLMIVSFLTGVFYNNFWTEEEVMTSQMGKEPGIGLARSFLF
jgi:hypothetical protein